LKFREGVLGDRDVIGQLGEYDLVDCWIENVVFVEKGPSQGGSPLSGLIGVLGHRSRDSIGVGLCDSESTKSDLNVSFGTSSN